MAAHSIQGSRVDTLQHIAMTLTRVHATDSCVAATVPCYTAPNEDSETTTILPCSGEIGNLILMLLNLF